MTGLLLLALAAVGQPVAGQQTTAAFAPTAEAAALPFGTFAYRAKLDGGKSVPPVESKADGTFQGGPTVNGPVIIWLETAAPADDALPMLSPPVSGTQRYAGTFGAEALGGPVRGRSISDVRRLVDSGQLQAYVNVHTQAPAAERAAAAAPRPEGTFRYTAQLAGSNSVPPIESKASGMIDMTCTYPADHSKDSCSWWTMAHIHEEKTAPADNALPMLNPPVSGEQRFQGTFGNAAIGGPGRGTTLADDRTTFLSGQTPDAASFQL
ncbi:hypothetical protein ABPG75_012731 [Micractinium tetrahymenae]